MGVPVLLLVAASERELLGRDLEQGMDRWPRVGDRCAPAILTPLPALGPTRSPIPWQRDAGGPGHRAERLLESCCDVGSAQHIGQVHTDPGHVRSDACTSTSLSRVVFPKRRGGVQNHV